MSFFVTLLAVLEHLLVLGREIKLTFVTVLLCYLILYTDILHFLLQRTVFLLVLCIQCICIIVWYSMSCCFSI